MAVSFSRISWWFRGGKEKEVVANQFSPKNSCSEIGAGLKEPESLKFKRVDLPSSSKKVKKQKWQSRKETRIDWEYDFVMVPSVGDGIQMPDSADEADWSIGWFEPHGPNFQSEDSFAVLVPSYSHRCKELVESSNVELLAAIKNSPESNNYMEQWLSSLQNSES
ncbi:uncharacterized protein LOC111005581 isoform X1 [Momordica charantia]|uniref:Uncharacterized protein LOC111005581 isoform X1 n=1 Tax=Momordica charantia TaxID=3673 RepID=A0A6J1BTJ7_MOMCH|nr:uncharacterized protein LOC111005581 isoform X1 [Momordica charantia]XP_022132825.1 uncharacterized protein LOC111005581 isoform X1 [Momordica charantia]